MDSGILELLEKHLPGGLDLVYRILWCLVLFAVGRKLIKAVQAMADRSFERADMETGVRKFLNSLLYFGLYGVLLFILAGQIGVDSASIVAILGSAGLALGLALQESLKNFAGGVLILLMKPFKVGDYIVTSAGEGTVSMIGLVYTTMTTTDNRTVVVPNGSLSNSPLTNVTGLDKRRLDIKVNVDYDADVRRVRRILQDTLENYPLILPEEPLKTFLDSMMDSYVVVGGYCWVKTTDYWQSKWDLTEEVKYNMEKAGISMAYAHLDVKLVGTDREDTPKGELEC